MRLVSERTKKIYVPNDRDKAFVIIKALDLETKARISSDFTTISSKEVTINDLIQRDNTLAKNSITEWDKMFDDKNNPLPFNAKNLELAAHFVVVIDGERKRFFEWVNEEREKFELEVIKEEEAALKN